MEQMVNRCYHANKCLILESVGKLHQPTESQLEFQTTARSCFGLEPIINELVTAKGNANRTGRYVRSLRHYLLQFIAGREHLQISDFTTDVIEFWLAKYPAPNTRRTWLSRLSAFFSFAVRRGYIESNPCDKIERVTMERKPPRILSVEESRLLLRTCPTLCKPYLILGMFAGIRPEELERLDWSQVNLETKTVTIDFGKTRRRRILPLEQIAVDLLREHPLRTGPVAPSHSTIVRWKKKARALLNLERFPQDLLRHTAASYLYEKHSDAAKVAKWLGNSVKVLMDTYVIPVTVQDCAAFWGLTL